MPSDTSLRAYEYIKPQLSDREQHIVQTVEQADGAMTTREILADLGVGPIGWQPRVSDLADKGVLKVVEKRPCTEADHNIAVKAYEVDM